MNSFYRIENTRYTLGNSYIERTWEYNGHSLYTLSLNDRISGRRWTATGHTSMDFCYEGLTCFYGDLQRMYGMQLNDVSVNEITGSIYSADGLEMVFSLEDKLHGVDIRLHAIVYEAAPAIRTYLEVKSYNLPMGEFYDRTRLNAIDSYAILFTGGKLLSYEFFTRTDLTNELVKEKLQPDGFDKGNLLLYQATGGEGFFILKESPCFSDERPETEGNFYISDNLIQTLGWGIRPEEIPQTGFMKTYGSVIGLFNGDYTDAIIALKKYQNCRAVMNPDKDSIIMVNPWGDRQCYEHMGEDFIISELKAASEMGATHYQLDDGWQKGKGLIQLVNNVALEDDYWEIDEKRFPNSFYRITEVAKELGIELALWYAPDFNRLFRNYREQAELLYAMYKKFGIKRFKIDAVKLRSKEAEDNLEHLLDELRRKTNGDISFNLDTTADPRAGYFMFQEYGNIFLENRYTDWGNYYPWLTLKNLWDLCAFVPPQRLQIEFLNIKRNIDKYNNKDTLAPQFYTPEYVFAITMFASPLCWFEASSLDDGLLKRYAEIIDFYKKHWKDIFSGYIVPVGERPSGYSWTGFVSHNPDSLSGYFIAFRECSDKPENSFEIPFFKNKNVNLNSIFKDKGNCKIENCDGRIKVFIEDKNDFRLFKYIIS